MRIKVQTISKVVKWLHSHSCFILFLKCLQCSLFMQDISEAQKLATATKSPMNISIMSREIGGVKVCPMEKVRL